MSNVKLSAATNPVEQPFTSVPIKKERGEEELVKIVLTVAVNTAIKTERGEKELAALAKIQL